MVKCEVFFCLMIQEIENYIQVGIHLLMDYRFSAQRLVVESTGL